MDQEKKTDQQLRDEREAAQLEAIKAKTLFEMSAAEIEQLRRSDPEVYKEKAAELDGKTEVPVTIQNRTIFRNGIPVEISETVKYVNGVKQ